MNKENSIVKWRVYLVLFFFLIIFIIVFVQLYRVQIIGGETYSRRAEKQHLRPVSGIFDRGSIFFSQKDGNLIDAASLKAGYTIAINPKILKHPEDVYNNLGFYLDLDEDFYNTRAEKDDDPYEEIAKRVSYEAGEKIKTLDMQGVSIIRENWRFYPGNDLAAQTIGFVSYSGDELKGQYGLESQYDDILERKHGNTFQNFFVEMFSNINDIVLQRNSPKGSIVTTIEPEVQAFVKNELNEVQEEWKSKKIGAIVMNPQNGEIYSMALYPTFNLNEFNIVEDPMLYGNPLVESVYEMGSIVKPLTMAAGLDIDVVTPTSTYYDAGHVTLNTETFYNYDLKGRGTVSMQEVLNQSLNTGVAYVVSQMGNDRFAGYMKELFGEKTGIDLPGEVSSLISNLDSTNDIEYATASFGQGIAMSPISITRALAALGNGGLLVQPHLVKEIKYDLGISKKIDVAEPKRIFKEETSEEITRMLVSVVDDALKGGTVALKDWSIAAKTGTAQIAKIDGRGYYDDRYLHSFFGYFPAYDPQLIVFLYHIEPQGARYASETLTKPFMNIAKFLIQYYEIPPDRENWGEEPILEHEGNN